MLLFNLILTYELPGGLTFCAVQAILVDGKFVIAGHYAIPANNTAVGFFDAKDAAVLATTIINIFVKFMSSPGGFCNFVSNFTKTL
ncbi:MAG: hypothetical protein ACRDBM_07040 [Sporomusa sp.]